LMPEFWQIAIDMLRVMIFLFNRRRTQTCADSIFSSRRPVGRKTCMPCGQTGFK
jgi:hypothetical protein